MATYKLKAKKLLEKTRLVAMRLPLSHVKMLDELAVKDGENLTTLFRQALKDYLTKRGKIQSEAQ